MFDLVFALAICLLNQNIVSIIEARDILMSVDKVGSSLSNFLSAVLPKCYSVFPKVARLLQIQNFG